MNENKIDYCEGLIQQGLGGLNGDFNSYECGKSSYGQYFDTIRQACNNQPQEQQQHIGTAAKSLSATAIMSRFESPASAFYAAELCMGFADHNQSLSPRLCNKMNNDLEFPLYQSQSENNIFLLDSENKSDPNFEMSNTLQAMVKSQIEKQKVSDDRAAALTVCSPFPSIGNRDHRVGWGSNNNSPFAQLNFSSHHDKSQTLSSGSISATSGGNPAVSSKTRIRWTQDLHEKFVESVNCLGGADKATPKAVLKMMDSDVLTIFHVKSHLQKYRIAKYMPESTPQGKSEKRNHIEDVQVQPLDVKTGFQIREALQLQLDTQRRLHEQLEIQRKLQLRIEEQGRQLKRMFDEQQKTTNSLLNPQNHTTNNDETSISGGS